MDENGEVCNVLQNVSDMAQDALVKLSQEYIGARESDRRFSKLWFKGKIKAQDGQKPWAFVAVHPGLCSAAFDSLRSEGIDCIPRYDNPHISFIREEEVAELKKKFGPKWRGAVKEGQPIRFSLERIVHLIPKSWDDVDRVWFLEVDSPDLRKIRAGLGLTELPTKGEHHFRFHITFAIRKSHTKAAAEMVGEIAKAVDPNVSLARQTSTDQGVKLQEVFDKMEVDPNVTLKTLGAEYSKVSPDLLMRTSQKLLNINKGTETTDDRDSLAFQIIHGPEDFFAERISKDAGQVARKLLWKATLRSNLEHVPSGALTPQLRSVLLNSGMVQPLEEINPFDAYDQSQRVVRLGEGAIPSVDAIPEEARNVQNSHLGFIDPVRSPESEKIGVDVRITHRLMKGSDGRLYASMLDVRTGKEKPVSAEEASGSVIAFPGEMDSDRPKVRAMVRSGKVAFVNRDQVDFALPSHTQMFSSSVNLIPMLGAIKGGRALMGGKYPSQALPLRDPESPLVRSLAEDGKTFVHHLGAPVGAVRSDSIGTVEKVTADTISIRTPEGKKAFELAHNFPYNRKTLLHNTPIVKIGDQVQPGQLLATSNYTDGEGNLALGKNLRVGYLPYKGLNYEDAILVSESAAQRLSSEHMYQHPLEPEEGTEIGRKQFVSLYPAQFTAAQLKTMDEHGVVHPGTKVKNGDPLILAVKRTIPTKLARSNKPMYVPSAVTWDHDVDGIVTDADETRDGGYNVTVKAYAPLQEGDKLSGHFGNKGVVSRIFPDDKMPRDSQGRPLEVLLNPLGVLARNNTAQVYEALLGKVAAKTGKPIDVPGFMNESMIDYVQKQLKDNGLTDAEDLEDPETGRKIPAVLTGVSYLMKLHHTAEAKSGGRDIGSYTAEGIPAKGGEASSKRIGSMETNAIISHGATEVLKDAKIIRGQRNDDFWRAFRLGYPPPSPKVPFVYEKFMASLQGAGVNVKKDGNRLHLFALTDKDVDQMSAGAIKSADTVEGDDFKPVPGGLFDESLTGGAGGNRWSHISLSEPLPNPVMEEPIRRLLGMTKNNYREVISGKKELWGKTGGEAIKTALGKLSVESEMHRYEDILRHGPRSKRDDAAKALGYLKTVKDKGIDMQDWVMTKWPVLPPSMRPITVMRNMQMVADPNYLYRDLFYANNDLSEIKGVVGSKAADKERLRVYDGMKAVAGLGDPIQAKTQEKNAKGLLAHVFGNSPKTGLFQRRVLNSAVDVVGRATITPNPELGMDQVGLPEAKAWTIYRPFVVRNLVRRGLPSAQAAIEVANQSKTARDALVDEIGKRPVIINRAPTLHRYGFMAAWPVLVKNDTLQLPPPIVSGFNADFDGNCVRGLSKIELKFAHKAGMLTSVTQLEEAYAMRFSEKTEVVAILSDGITVEMAIKDVPRLLETLRHDKNGADVYDVPPGISTLSHDSAKACAVWQPVTQLTVEKDREVVRVKTRDDHEVVCTPNESLAVYDHATGDLVKTIPAEAANRLCAVIRKQPVKGIEGDFEFGWMLGAFASDGFLMRGTDYVNFGYTKLDDAKRERFAKAVNAHEGREVKRNTYRGVPNEQKLGSSAKDHYSDAPKTLALFKTFYVSAPKDEPDIRAACLKRLPDLQKFNEQTLLGVLSGLLDGDGSVSISNAKNKPQILVNFSTSSASLVTGLKQLGRLLGIRVSDTPYEPKEGRLQTHTAYIVTLSAVDVRLLVPELKLTSLDKMDILRQLERQVVKDDRDIVPVPDSIVNATASKLGPLGKMALTGTMATLKSGRKPYYYMARETARRLCALLSVAKLPDDLFKCFEKWQRLVVALEIGWTQVASVEPAGREDVYDMAVTDTKVFAVNGGLIVYDTMNYHVPVSDEAVKDAVEKMMPSRNLKAVRDFKVHYLPRHEFMMGLYLASKAKNANKPRLFRSRADVTAAYQRGDIGIGDKVIVSGA